QRASESQGGEGVGRRMLGPLSWAMFSRWAIHDTQGSGRSTSRCEARIAWGGHAWLLGGIVLLAVLLRFPTVDSQSYWADEFLTVTLLKLRLPEMLGAIQTNEGMPPLYYVLAWLWTKPFGTAEAGLRSLSALFGTATVPVAYMAARDLARSQRAGLVTAALVAV